MRNANKYIISKEIASREHIQCYVVTNVVKKTWVNKFNLKFKDLDRRDKYVELDKGQTKYYVCKGDNKETPPVVLAKLGFTDEDVIEFHQEYWKDKKQPNIEEILLSPSETIIKKQPKLRKPTFMCECRNELEDLWPEKEWAKKDKLIVFKKVMYKLGSYCKCLDHVILSRMTYGVLNSLIKNTKEWHEYWFQKSFGEAMSAYEDFEDMSLDIEN